MPKLPDDSVLGGLPSANSGRIISTFDTSAPGRAAETLGQGITNLGKGIASGLNSYAEETGKLDETRAKSGYLTEKVKLDEEMRNESDPEALKAYPGKYQALSDKWGGTLSGRRREAWNLDMAPKVAADVVRANTALFDINKKQAMADSVEHMDTLRSIGTDPKSSEEDRNMALELGNEYIRNLQDEGFYDAKQAADARKAWVKGYVFDSLKMMTPEDRAVALSEPYTATEKEERAYRFFLSKGWQPAQAAAIVGVLSHESGGLNTGARNQGDGSDGSDSIGLAQWNAERAKALKAFAAANGKDWRDFDVQLAFVDHELNSTHSGAADALKRAGSVRDATNAFTEFYERPAGTGQGGYENLMGWADRLRRASAIGQKFGNIDPGTVRGRQLAGFLAPDEQTKVMDEAETEYRTKVREQQQARGIEVSAVKTLMSEDASSVANTGKPMEGLTTERVRNALGEQAAQDFDRNRAQAQRYYDQTNDFDRISEAQMGERLKALDPRTNGDAGKPGYELASKWYDTAVKRAQEVVKERNNDPAAAADRQADVAPAKQGADLNQPETYVPLVRRRMEAQARLGVMEDNRVPFTKAEISAIFQPVARALPGDEKEALQQTVELLQKALGGDRDLVDAALEQGLKAARVDKETRKVAAIVMRKLGMGETPDAEDLRKADEARKQDAQAAAAAAILNVPPVGNPMGDVYTGQEYPPEQQGPPAPRIKSMTRDELAQLWSMPDNKKMVEKYVEVFGREVVEKALQARPQDWDADLAKRHASGNAQAPKRELQFGPGNGVFEQLRRKREEVMGAR